MAQPATTQQTPKSLSEIASQYVQDVTPAELADILVAVQTLKRGSGWGNIRIIYLAKEVDTIEILITRKKIKK